MLAIETIHHVSVPVTQLATAKAFYGGVLGLTEIPRPAFTFEGAWYRLGDRHLHLIVAEGEATLRHEKPIDSHDVHFAIRVHNFEQAVNHMRSHGYQPDAQEPRFVTRENWSGAAGFPQLYVLDPDHNVIEINAEHLSDTEAPKWSGTVTG